MTGKLYGAILCAVLVCGVTPVQAQQVLDRYTAEIGAQDRFNSRGTPLSQPGQILAQDRANVHRFGIRQAGDTPDRTFTSTEARQRIESLLSRGTMGPNVREALTGGGTVQLDVQVIGSNGRADRLVVTLANGAMPSSAAPRAGAPQAVTLPQQITGGPVAPGQGQWTFASADVGGVIVASANLLRDGALLATLRCTASAASGPVLGIDPRAGVLTLQLSPAITGPQVEGGRTAKLHFGTLPALSLPLTFDPEVRAYSVSRLLTRRLSDDLERGARFSLTTQIAGTIHAPIPQNIGMTLASACGARGLDPSVSPSFDCTRPRHPSEMLICYDPELAALDRELGAALAGASDVLKASQPSWISARNGCSTDADCISRLTQDRIAMLTGATAAPGTGAAQLSGMPAFKLMPDAAPAPDDGEVIVGNQSFMDRFLLWTVGQNPALATNQQIQFRLRDFDFPPHLPEVPPTESSGEKAQARLEAAAPLYADRPPRHVVLEETMYLRQAEPGMPGPLNLHGGFATMIGTTPAIVQIELRDRGAGAMGTVRLDLDKPFYLPFPENYTPLPHAMLQGNKGQSLALIEMTVSDPVPSLRGDSYRGGSAKAVVSKVTLVYRPRQRDARNQIVDGPDQILHVWEGGDGSAEQVTRPADPAAIARLFGGGVSNGRYVLNPYSAPKPFVEETRGILQGSSPTELVSTAMQLAAVIAAQPERTLAPELTEYLLRNLLTEPERVELFPLNIATQMPNNKPSELELRAAYTQADQAMRDRIAERSPQLPLPLRYAAQVSIGEYDFSSGGFPVSRVPNPGPWIPTTTERQPVTTLAPDFIKMSPEEAQTLLDRLSRSGTNGRSLVFVLDYSMDALGFRSVSSGPITRNELGSVAPSYTIASMGYYLPDDQAQPLMPIAIPDDAIPSGPKAAKPPSEGGFTTKGGLPDEVLYTSARSLLGAVDLRDADGTLLNDALTNAYDILPPDPRSTYETRRDALRSELRAQARDSYWVGASFQIQPYDAQLGGFPISDVNFEPVPYQRNADKLDPPALIPAEPEDYEVLRLPDAAVPVLQEIIGGQRQILALFKVTPVETVNDRRLGRGLTISAPVEAIFDDDRRGVTPLDADLWVHVAAPKRIDTALPGAADAAEVEAPEALMLDPEGISLLALSLAPDAFDDTMFRRMLVERLLKERSIPTDAPEGDAELVKPDKLAWRRFFANPDQSLRADAVDALLPEFKAWTMARVAALPEILLTADRQSASRNRLPWIPRRFGPPA